MRQLTELCLFHTQQETDLLRRLRAPLHDGPRQCAPVLDVLFKRLREFRRDGARDGEMLQIVIGENDHIRLLIRMRIWRTQMETMMDALGAPLFRANVGHKLLQTFIWLRTHQSLATAHKSRHTRNTITA